MAQEVAKKSPSELPKNVANTDAALELSKTLNAFLQGYSSPSSSQDEIDVVARRFKVEFNSPLPDYNSPHATCYLAIDLDESKISYIALVCDANVIQRTDIIKPLMNSPHPNLMTPTAADVTYLSRLQEERFVIIYEKPKGTKLSVLIAASKTTPSFEYICQYIISPIGLAIKHLSEMGIVHSSINCDNIYFDVKSTSGAVLGDCISAPPGYQQHFYYEPVERMQALPAGKGIGESSHDFYALAVVILHIIYGMNHFSGISQNTLIKFILKHGAFNALTRNKDMPEVFYDFFRGLLSHNANDRWNYKYLKAWLDGKRYNVMPTPPQHEAIRPFEFAGELGYTRREVANIFANHWQQIPEAFTSGQLSTWVAISLRNKELNEYLLRTAKIFNSVSKKIDVSILEQIMRTIAVFDPAGPVRIGNLSFHLDGINTLFADLLLKNSQDDLKLLMQFIDLSMFQFVGEQKSKENIKREESDNSVITTILSKLDRLRGVIRNSGIGFGYERIFYDLNPSARCMSPKFAGVYVSSLATVLTTLDKLAPRLSATDDPIDQHIAAFITSQLNIQYDINISSLSAQPSLAKNPAIIALKLLSMAQHKTKIAYLPGLTNWLAIRILPLFDNIRSKTLKRKLVTMLGNAARSGSTIKMAEVIIESGYAGAEATAYKQAVNSFKRNSAEIIYYTKKEYIEAHSRMLGARMAHYLAILGLVYSFILAVKGS